jgi:hypothetical protein
MIQYVDENEEELFRRVVLARPDQFEEEAYQYRVAHGCPGSFAANVKIDQKGKQP